MNKYKSFLLAAPLMALAITASAAPIIVPRDTVIPVTMDSAVSSATAQAGDYFYAHQSGVNGETFPNHTKFTGTVVSVDRASGKTAGQIGVAFVSAKLPNGRKVPIVGRLTALDEASTKTDPTTGRLTGTTTGGNKDLKFIAIGAGAGALIGQFTKKRPLTGTLIGAAAGYIYSRTQAKAAIGKNVQVAAGTRFGIILDRDVTVPGSVSETSATSDDGTNPGQQMVFNNLQPVLSGNSLMVPFRSAMDSLDMPFDYNASTKGIQMTRGDEQVSYNVGSSYVYLDGKPTRMDTASRMINGSIYVPASYVELLTKKTADWDEDSGILSLD